MKQQEHLDDTDLISRYLLGQLEGQELQEFTFRLIQDKAFQEEVDRNRLLMKVLWKAGRENGGPAPKKGISNWWGLPLLLLLIIGGAYIFWPISADKPPTIQQPPQPSSLPSAPATDKVEEPVPTKENKEVDRPTKQPDKVRPNKTPRSQPIAANFEPNPMLETLMDNPVRAAAIQLRITTPSPEASLEVQNGTLTFQLSGEGILGDDSPVLPDLVCSFFSNKEEAFENSEPLFSQRLQLNATDTNNFNFSLQQILKGAPDGLYYYIISDEQEENLHYIGKVYIRR